MYINIDSNCSKNMGSVSNLAYYLEKENNLKSEEEKESFFNQDKDNIDVKDIINEIDSNNIKLGKKDSKFYSMYISPSKNELIHLKENPNSLKEYTRDLMNEYAKNFNKGLKADDLLYFGKVEYERKFKGFDNQVKLGFVSQGEIKNGPNMHVHIIVSRRCKNNGSKISPLVTNKKSVNVKVGNNFGTKGFDRDRFYAIGESLFDEKFNYKREYSDSYKFHKLNKNLNISNSKTPILTTSLDKEIYLKKHITEKVIYSKSFNELENNLKSVGIKISSESEIEKSKSIGFEVKNLKKRINPFKSNFLNQTTNQSLISILPQKVVQSLKEISYFHQMYKQAEKQGKENENDKENEY